MALKSVLNFTIGPREVTVIYDKTSKRLIMRAVIHNGKRVDRVKEPELWAELRDDFLHLFNPGRSTHA